MKKSKQFELLYNQLEADHMLRGRPRSYQDLKSLVRMHLEKETRDKHLEANRNPMIKDLLQWATGSPAIAVSC